MTCPHIHSQKFFSTSNEASISESNPAGAGVVKFSVQAECKVFIPGENPIGWLKNQKCADGAIIIPCDRGGYIVHLVELKSKINASMWSSIKEQFEGLLQNVKALSAVSNLGECANIRAYVAYKDDKISKEKTAAPILLKMPVGQHNEEKYNTHDWQAGEVELLGLPKIPLIKIERDANGNAQTKLHP